MPITHDTAGDILKSSCQTLVCPVNTVGIMGAGLALAMNQQYQGLLQQYREACQKGILNIETLWVFKVNNRRQILCFPTKEHWRNPSKVKWIDHNLELLAKTYKDLGITSLAMPRIGCGRGQLDWEPDIRPLVYKHLKNSKLPIVVYGP